MKRVFSCNFGITFQMAVLLLTFTSCTPPPNFSQNPATYKTVAVISLLPQTITMSHIGFTVFQNDFATYPLDWDPNIYATQTAESLLSQHYQLKHVNVNSAAIIAAVSQKYTDIDLGDTSGLVSAELKADVAPGQADLIVVIDASAASHISGVFDQTIQAGLRSTSGVDSYGIGTQQDDIHLDALLNVYDGTTFSRLATGVGPLYIDATGSVTPDRASGLNWRGQPLESFSAEQKEQLKAAEQSAIRYFLNTALKDVNLTGD